MRQQYDAHMVDRKPFCVTLADPYDIFDDFSSFKGNNFRAIVVDICVQSWLF